MLRPATLALLAAVLAPASSLAAPADSASRAPARIRPNAVVDTLPTVEVTDTFDRALRRVRAASQHGITAAEIAQRPVSRPGEILEAVPGLVISQHSGEGKANQYYLRGFNLDHGTDFATFVAGMPVNMPTHGHGQGYSDLNFLIPELVSGIEYRKGTAWAEEGDFGTAGAAHIAYRNRLDAPVVEASGGEGGYRRVLGAGSATAAGGDLLAALEVFRNDGPWRRPDDYRKVNGVLRWSRTAPAGGLRLTAMGYDGRWRSTDQVPRRAVEGGSLDRFGAVDPTDGGRSDRQSLSADWQRLGTRSFSDVTAYVVRSRLNLFSNFTYFLDDTTNGDQFEQEDDRVFYGVRASHTFRTPWRGRDASHVLGVQARRDDIARVGLYHTRAQERLETTRADRVAQSSVSPFAESTVPWTRWLRTTVGLRADLHAFRVRGDDARNSGTARAAIVSPKLAVALGPWASTAAFANVGTGFHSNDARGTTITVDPASGDPVRRVDPLVRATSAELGLVTHAVGGAEMALSAWGLELDSELLFVGDAGTTDASRPSRRTGLEWSVVRAIGSSLRLDADLAWSRARFTDGDPAGDRIPGAVEGVVTAGITVPDWRGNFGSLRARWFGPRPLIEDNTVRSRASGTLTAEVGRTFTRWGRVSLECFNLLDARVSDVDYFYTSRLRGEPEGGADDVHSHPQAPRTFRLRLAASFPRAASEIPDTGGHPKSGVRR